MEDGYRTFFSFWQEAAEKNSLLSFILGIGPKNTIRKTNRLIN